MLKHIIQIISLTALLLTTTLSLAASFSVAIKNDPEAVKYYAGGPEGPFTFELSTGGEDETITCNGKACPTQIKENETIIFTVSSPTIQRYLGFEIIFTSSEFGPPHRKCHWKYTYWISSGKIPTNDGKMNISELPPFGGTRNAGVACN